MLIAHMLTCWYATTISTCQIILLICADDDDEIWGRWFCFSQTRRSTWSWFWHICTCTHGIRVLKIFWCQESHLKKTRISPKKKESHLPPKKEEEKRDKSLTSPVTRSPTTPVQVPFSWRKNHSIPCFRRRTKREFIIVESRSWRDRNLKFGPNFKFRSRQLLLSV